MINIPYFDNFKNKKTALNILQSSDLDFDLIIKQLYGSRNWVSVSKPTTLIIISNGSDDEAMDFTIINNTSVNIYYGFFTIDTINTELKYTSGFGVNGPITANGGSSNLMSGGRNGFNPDDLIIIATCKVTS